MQQKTQSAQVPCAVTTDHQVCFDPLNGDEFLFSIDADLALDSATDLLDAVIGGLQEIVSEPSVSSQVSLMLHAVETAQALVRAALEGGEVAND